MTASGATEYQDGNHEVSAVLNEIDERAGPRSLAILAIVTSDSLAETRDRCISYGFDSVFVETEHTYASRIRTLSNIANTTPQNRLSIVISPSIPTISLKVPSQFRRLEIVACTKERSALSFGSTPIKELVLEEDSKYCNIVLAHWNARTTFLEHELATGPGVVLELPDERMLDGEPQPPPFKLGKSEDVVDAAKYIEKQVSADQAREPALESKSALPWLAGITGAVAGVGSAGAFLISSVKITTHGLFVAAGPYAAGWNSATATASLAMAGGAMGTGIAVGAAVTAAVYFIPWRKLGSWLLDAFDRFLDFLKSIWVKVTEKFEFLKTILVAILNAIKAVGSGVLGFASSGVSALTGLLRGSSGAQSGPMKLS